jgi:hypothetical protein
MFTSCGFKIKTTGTGNDDSSIVVERYDRLESRYLTTGDYSALQQMNTDYPRQTRTLLEDILKLGEVNDASINSRFLALFQDTMMQEIISDAELQYANVEDLNKQLTSAFNNLKKILPAIEIPSFYTQITALDQSIVVGDKMVGISLDKYLGSDYLIYHNFYADDQMTTMSREYIVPDCLCFYLLSIYPLEDFDTSEQWERDLHMAKIMWVANRALGKRFFTNGSLAKIETYMRRHVKVTAAQLLNTDEKVIIEG